MRGGEIAIGQCSESSFSYLHIAERVRLSKLQALMASLPSLTVRSFLTGAAALALGLTFPLSTQAEPPKPAKVEVGRHDPGKFKKEIDAFAAADQKKEPVKGGIVFTGSSSIRLWKSLPQDFPDLPVLNRGFGGSIANDLVVYSDQICLKYEPKLVVVYTGSNDIHKKLTVEEALSDYTKFVNTVHEKLPKTRFIINSVKFSTSRIQQMDTVKVLNTKLQAWCAERDWTRYVDGTSYLLDSTGKPDDSLFRTDKLHLNEKGYAQWKTILEPVVREEWAKVSGK